MCMKKNIRRTYINEYVLCECTIWTYNVTVQYKRTILMYNMMDWVRPDYKAQQARTRNIEILQLQKIRKQ